MCAVVNFDRLRDGNAWLVLKGKLISKERKEEKKRKGRKRE